MPQPHQYSQKLLMRFEKALHSNAIACAPVELIQGDFLHCHPYLQDALRNAGLVYINNPKFEPSMNLGILQLLCPLLPKSAKLICFESLIGTKGYWDNCMVYKSPLVIEKNAVSWHGNGVILHILEKL